MPTKQRGLCYSSVGTVIKKTPVGQCEWMSMDIPQHGLQATDSSYHTGSTIPNLRITGNIMGNPLIPHKRTGERKPWAKYIQIPQKKENVIFQTQLVCLLGLMMLCAMQSLWVVCKGQFLLYFLMFSDTVASLLPQFSWNWTFLFKFPG